MEKIRGEDVAKWRIASSGKKQGKESEDRPRGR